jgi:hypothetical protein
MAQKRCTPAKEKTNAFDCMVDQPDGSVKKTRYFQALNHKKSKPMSESEKAKDQSKTE